MNEKKMAETLNAAKKLFSCSANEVIQRSGGFSISEIIGNAVCALMTIAETARDKLEKQENKKSDEQ